MRQWLYPREFRIAAPVFPASWRESLEELARQSHAGTGMQAKEQREFLIKLAIGLWRLRRKMLVPGSDKPLEQFRREYLHLESVWEHLRASELVIRDHTGEAFDPGQTLEVATRVPTAGLKRERVQDTIKPTIYFRGEHIGIGVVIVETPA